MKIIYLIIIGAIAVFFLSTSEANASSYNVVICDTCSSHNSFEKKAKITNFGLILVVNRKQAIAKFFHVTYEAEFGEYIVDEFPLPTGTINTLNLAKELDNYIDSLDYINMFGNFNSL